MLVLMMSLMHELEGLLHEYLSYNWDRVDSVLDANREALRCAATPAVSHPGRRLCGPKPAGGATRGKAC